MPDRGLSDSPPPARATSKKRKAASTSTAVKSKRAKTAIAQQLLDPFANAKDAIRKALASPNSFALPDDDAGMRGLVLSISEYAKSLEGSVAVAGTSGELGPPPKTSQQIADGAKRIAATINSGISKQMSWKPTCAEGRTKFEYDGYCADPRVFGAVLKMDRAPRSFTMNKYTKDEFEEMVGCVKNQLMYDCLYLTSDVRMQWNEETGEFNIRGKYGKRPKPKP